MPASPSQPTADAETDEPLSVLVKTSYSWADPESMETSGSARAPEGSMLAGTTPVCQAGSGSTALRPPPPPPFDPALRPVAPGDLARGAGPRVIAGRVDHDRGAADGDDVGRGGRIVRDDLVGCRCA